MRFVFFFAFGEFFNHDLKAPIRPFNLFLEKTKLRFGKRREIKGGWFWKLLVMGNSRQRRRWQPPRAVDVTASNEVMGEGKICRYEEGREGTNGTMRQMGQT